MHRHFTLELHNSLKSLPDSTWLEFFPDHPDPPQLIALIDKSGLEGFKFYSLIVKRGEEPVVVLPLFETRYPIVSTLGAGMRRFGPALEAAFPSLFKPKVLGVGFIEGEWGQIGVNPRISSDVIHKATEEAFEYLHTIARAQKIDLLALKDFTDATLLKLPLKQSSGKRADSLPFCEMDIPFSSVDDYLEQVPRKVRQDLRRKMRQSSGVRIKYSKEPQPWLDTIYALYADQVRRSGLSLGLHNTSYFDNICKTVPGAGYFLFFLGDELIGFNLVIDRGDRLVDKYIGLDPERGREFNIYFLAWLEKIKYCTAHGIKRLHLGASAEGIKVRLGARMRSSYVYFEHQQKAMNWLLSKFIKELAYEPEVKISVVENIPSIHPESAAVGLLTP